MQEYEPDNPEYLAAYRRAERRVQARLAFYWHLASYVIVNGMLIVIFLLTGPIPGFYTYPWFVWPMAGWGIGLMFHYLGVFVFQESNVEQVRRSMIEEELRRMGVGSTNPFPPTDSNSGASSTSPRN